jgi:hypothetical protein
MTMAALAALLVSSLNLFYCLEEQGGPKAAAENIGYEEKQY